MNVTNILSTADLVKPTTKNNLPLYRNEHHLPQRQDAALHAQLNGILYEEILPQLRARMSARMQTSCKSLANVLINFLQQALVKGAFTESRDGRSKTCQSGFYDSQYDPIYMVFQSSATDWRGFVNMASAEELQEDFDLLPDSPFAESRLRLADFAPIDIHWDHILYDRPERLCREILELGPEIDIPDNLGHLDPVEKYMYTSQWRLALRKDPAAYGRMQRTMHKEILWAVKKAYATSHIDRNFNVAQQSWEYLLPLCFHHHTPQMYLVVSGNCAYTILTANEAHKALALGARIAA